MADNENRYAVVRNDEEQYSIWPVGRAVPDGWSTASVQGSREECIEHIGRVWTDMRPRSLRERMATTAAMPHPKERS